MQKSDYNQTAISSHRRVKSSTTLNRKYVKRPSKSDNTAVVIKRSPKVSHFDVPIEERKKVEEKPVAPAVAHPMQTSAYGKMRKRAENAKLVSEKRPTAKELKDAAIKKALAAAATEPTTAKKPKKKIHFGFGRVVLALACAGAAVFAIAYFVNLNMPDISLKVAAMQTGIEASYPTYVPRDFALSDITSENGKITLNFKNSTTGDSFSLIEETSSWDSNALLTNYVKEEFGENYSTIREQGLTIYINNSNAAWVNGGIVYKLNITSGSLTKKQIKSIAVSL